MKEIGEELKQARESSGLTTDEVASDLNLRVSQIENIEQGNMKAFKDVYYLKCFVRDYAKYLGLDEEKIMDAKQHFNIEAYFKNLCETNKLAQEQGFHFCRCSGWKQGYW